MRIVFIGSVKFSARCLEGLLLSGNKVVGVCTLKNSNYNSDHFDLTQIADKYGIPSKYTPDINSSESVAWIKKHQPDVIFCLGWSRLIQRELLELTELGVVGYHPALLPSNKGRHPIIWALVLGIKKTGSTFFIMDEGADSGDILSQKVVSIEEADDAGTLYDKLIDVALAQLDEFVPRMTNRVHTLLPQDPKVTNYWRKRTSADGLIDWRMSAEGINNLIRGLAAPYVGAHFIYKGSEVRVWRSRIVKVMQHNLEPGKIIGSGPDGPIVQTGLDAIELVQIEPRLDVSAIEYL